MTGRTVLVEGLGEDADEEWVIMVCENKRTGGGDVEEVKLLENGVALVTFTDSSVAAGLLVRSTITISGLTLRISEPQSTSVEPVILADPEPNRSLGPVEELHCDTLQVHASPSLPSEDVLMTYFESRRASGGEIKKLTIHDDGESATIVFKDPKVLWSVLKKEHKLGSTELQVSALESLKELDDAQSCAVEANGIPTHLSKDTVMMFFENKRQTGGDTVDVIFYDQLNGRAVLTYESSEVALRVSKKQSVVLEGQSIQVKLLQPMPPPPIVVGAVDPNKLLAKYLPMIFDDAELADYLKEPSGKDIVKVSRSRSPSVAVIVFSGVPGLLDYIACRRHVTKKPFLDRMISVQKVALCTQIIAFPLVPSLSDDMVQLHFESPRYGGGLIRDCSFHRNDGYVIITYEDRTVIDRVVRGQHSIDGHELRVDYYNQDLGPPPEAVPSNPAAEDSQGQGLTMALKQPEVIMVSDFVFKCDPKKLDFMTKNKRLKEQMEKELDAQCCSVVWPEDLNSGTIILKCTAFTAELAKEFSADDWTETCTSLIEKCFDRVLIGKLDIPEEIGSKFANQALGLKDGDGELMWEQSGCGGYVQYVGSEEGVEKFTKKCRSLTKKLLEEQQKENEIVSDVVDQVSDLQMQLLRISDFDKQKEGSTLHISITDKAVNFQGTRQEILDAKTKLYEVINHETTQNYPATKFKLTALDDKKIIEYVKNSLREKDIRVVVVSQKDKVVLSGLSRKDIDDAVRFLDSELIERKVMLDDASAIVLTMPQWTEDISKLKSSVSVLVVDVSPTQDSVMCLSTKDTLDKVVDEIEKILKSNIQTEQFLLASESKVKYMNKFMTTEINTTQNSLLSARISITMELNGSKSGVRVTGAPNGLTAALEAVKALTESVISYNYTNDVPGVQKAFKTKRGKDFIDALEHRSKVIIEVKESFVTTSPLGAQLPTTKNVKAKELTVKLEATLPNGIVIQVFKGDITKCKVDALVIPCNDRLQPSEDLAKLVHDTGGSAIQDECKKHIAVHGTLLEGRVFASKAGKLPFKVILHTVSPKWKDGKSKETDYLKEAVDNTLKEALSKNFESIAMSAISTGSFGFPPASATLAIIEGIGEFFADLKGQCCLKSIQLVDSSEQVVNYFHDALKTIRVSSIRRVDDDTVAPTNRNVYVKSPVSPPAALMPHPPNAATFSIATQAMTTSEGLTITLVLGAIAAQTVDVIVNTTSKEISFTVGAVSKSILDAAGPEISDACMKQSKGGCLKHDEVISTDSFKLPCKRVYHVACMGWDGDGGQCEKTTRKILSIIFKRASDDDKMTSIAIPAIGTGGLGLSKQLVAKMMYEEAINFSKTNPTTSLRQIRFVVFDKDNQTEFQKHLTKLSSSTNLQDTPTAPFRNRQLKRGNVAGDETLPSDAKKPNATEFALRQQPAFDFSNKLAIIGGRIELKIMQGDLTSQKTDAIVNCTNKELNLSFGAVASAIAKAGGPALIEDCKRIGTMTNGVAVTKSGNIGCKNIIHLEAADDSGDWITVIRRGLVEAERLQLNSISYPLLGTGARNVDPKQMAVMFFHAVKDFVCQDKPTHLKKVCVVIYQSQMVDEFTKAIAKETGAAPSPANVHGTAEAMGHGARPKAPTSIADERTSVLSFSITAKSQKDIDDVIKEIEEVGNEAMKDMVLDNEQYQKMIARLTEDQMKRIQMLERTDQVKIEIDKGKRINRIRIRGDTDDVAKAFEKITGIFHEAGSLAQQEMEAKLIAKEAQWEYNEGDQTYEAYPANINSIIEKAFQEKKLFAKWDEEDGIYQVDFTSMLETKENSAGSQVKVRRTGNIMIKYPDTWEQMNDGETFKKVRLTPGSAECLKVEARIKKDAVNEIVSIHRIQNSTLYKQCAAKKQHMEVVYASTPKVEIERRLWHGTKEETLQQIDNHGFNRSYSGLNIGALHGKGVYFATEWGYSARDEYSKPNAKGNKFIYQVAVLTGEFTKSHKDLFDAPLKPGSNVVKYDSVVDDVQDPQIFVVFSDHQAYPEYLIEFVPTTKSGHEASG